MSIEMLENILIRIMASNTKNGEHPLDPFIFRKEQNNVKWKIDE